MSEPNTNDGHENNMNVDAPPLEQPYDEIISVVPPPEHPYDEANSAVPSQEATNLNGNGSVLPSSASIDASECSISSNIKEEPTKQEENTEELSSSPASSVCSSTPLKTSITASREESTEELSSSPASSVGKEDQKMEPSTPLTEVASTMFFQDMNSDEESESDDNTTTNCHTRLIHKLQSLVIRVLQCVSGVAVEYPRLTLVALSVLSLGFAAAGLLTNFHVETDTADLWPPRNSLSIQQFKWLIDDSYFAYEPVKIELVLHKHGDNVLGQTGVERVFEAQQVFTGLKGYKEGCAFADLFGDIYWVGQCGIDSVTDFWNESQAIFMETVDNDEDAIEYLSSTAYPNGVSVDVNTIMGKPQRDGNGMLTSAESYLVRFNVPWSNVTLDFEAKALDRMLLLKEEWEARGDEFILEVNSFSSYSDEFLRSIQNDLWLLPLAFGIVAVFTVFFAFGKCDRVESRGLLGIGSVVTIVASMMTSFGLMFLIGIPFTTQTIMVPFLMFGIGLDDAFIIFGSYNRKSHIKDVKQRIHSTMQDIGVSIFLTSLTSMLAFILGSFSDIPAVKWLCLYAFPCIGIDFFYQLTFFVALLVLDERRIQQGRMDYCTCITVRKSGEAEDVENSGLDNELASTPVPDEHMQSNTRSDHVADRLMKWWSKKLMNRTVQLVALFIFALIAAGSIFCATKLEQQFDFVDLVPEDSYLKTYYGSLESYTNRDGEYSYVYFRGVDQSNLYIQTQMEEYIEDLVAEANVDEPVYFWLRDFRKFVAEVPSNSSFHDFPFDWQVREFLNEDIYYELYDDHIGRSRRGIVMET